MAVLTNAQTLTVLDELSSEPLKGVVLITQNPSLSVMTNARGQADIAVFQGASDIFIRLLGYKTQIRSFEDITNQQYEIRLEPSILNLDQVVVSGTRWRETSNDVPAQIALITSEEVALQNPQTAADLLSLSGKVFVQKSQQGGGSPMIRGFATNRLIYIIDGIRMNTAIFRGGNLQNVINLDPFATEHTEVSFGPNSVIYGSDAIGGVMSFQTLTPQFSVNDELLTTGKAILRYATANQEKTGHMDINLGWEKWALTTSFSHWDFGHLRQGKNGPDDYLKSAYVERQNGIDQVIVQEDPLLQRPSAYHQNNVMQKVRYKPNASWDFQYAYHFSQTSSYGRYDRHNRNRDGFPRYAEWNYGPQKWAMHNLLISHLGKNTWYDEMHLQLARQSFEESRIDRTFQRDDRTKNVENVDAYSVNLDWVKAVSQSNQLFYGLEFVIDDVRSSGSALNIVEGSITTGPSRYPESTWSSHAIYLSGESRLSDKLTIQAGVRYNRFILKSDFKSNLDFYPLPFSSAKVNNGALTGSIGTIYRPTDDWVIKANIGTAFRSPNVDVLGKIFDSEAGAVTVPNPSLKGEYAYNFDLGLARIIGKILKIDVAGYYTILNNAMVRRNYQLNGQDSIIYDGQLSQVQAIQNAAVAHVYGIQAGIEIKILSGLTLLSDINIQKGEEELDDQTRSPSRHAAPTFGVTRLRYRLENNCTLECNIIYQGQRNHEDLAREERGKDEIYAKDSAGQNYAPSWYTLNFKVRYGINKNWTLSGGLENITNQRYRPYSSGISGAGRNFIISLNAQF